MIKLAYRAFRLLTWYRGIGGDLFPPEPAAHGKFVLVHLLLLLLPWRSYGPASAHATVDVLLFLLRWLQNLWTRKQISMSVAWRLQTGDVNTRPVKGA